MSYLLKLCSLPCMAGLLLAAAPAWMTKRIAEWNAQDAQQVLTSSPWVRVVTATLLAGLSPYQRREGGDMRGEGGGRDGLGFDPSLVGGVVPMLTGINAPKKADHAGDAPKIGIRWESAMPIRAAEMKSKDTGAPELEGEDYAVAVYDVPLKTARVELKGLPEMLKKCAFLKIEGRKDIKPTRVVVMELGEGMATMVYLFPRSTKLSLADPRIEFDAQIGRVVVDQYFYTADMKFEGRLEL